MARRGRGEGSISQKHDHPSCPPARRVVIEGKRQWARDSHRCRGRWMAQLGPKSERVTVYGATKAEVVDKLKELHKKQPATGSAKGWTVERWMTHWLTEIAPNHAKKPSTRRGYRTYINTYIVPLIGKHRLNRLEPHHVERMYNYLRRDCPDPTPECHHDPKHEKSCPELTMACRHEPTHGHAEATVRQCHAILHRALLIAVRQGHVERNVASREIIDPPGTETNKRRPLSLEEARQVLSTVNGESLSLQLRTYIRLYYGERQGEVLGLRWCDVDRDGWDWFKVDKTLQLDENTGKPFLGDPKSKASKRLLPMVNVVRSRFQVAWAGHLDSHEQCRGGRCEHQVFTSPTGAFLRPEPDWREWRDLLAKAGVDHYAPHAARNTAASLLLSAGVPPALVKEILGHSTVLLSQDVYFGGDLEAKRKAIEGLL
jgi:integrase